MKPVEHLLHEFPICFSIPCTLNGAQLLRPVSGYGVPQLRVCYCRHWNGVLLNVYHAWNESCIFFKIASMQIPLLTAACLTEGADPALEIHMEKLLLLSRLLELTQGNQRKAVVHIQHPEIKPRGRAGIPKFRDHTTLNPRP